MSKFKIYGDYGYVNQTLLNEFDSLKQALEWAEDYANSGDLDGFTVIEVACFAEDGEYLVERAYRAEDWEDETVSSDEGYLWDEF
jgi:hypothetical protein